MRLAEQGRGRKGCRGRHPVLDVWPVLGYMTGQRITTMENNKALWGFFRRRQCLVPTLRGWLALSLLFGAPTFIGVRLLGPFLSVNEPAPGGVLVVEGWAPDYALELAMVEFSRNHYDKLFVTGVPLEQGAPLSEYKTYAELGAAILLKLGLGTNAVQPVPAMLVRKDRTYATAASLKRWMREHGMTPAKINLMTLGPHARRSRLMFEKAFGDGVTVGVMAIPCRDYDPAHWWRSSAGVRVVIAEGLAYVYARFFFSPPPL